MIGEGHYNTHENRKASQMKIAVGCNQLGLTLKDELTRLLLECGVEFRECRKSRPLRSTSVPGTR